MKNLFLILFLATPAYSQTCPGCIQNGPQIQDAQFNISSATIRGNLNVGSISISSFTASTVTANIFIGSGTYLTGLNASQILSGTVSSNAVTGAYPGITGIGTLSAGAWNGTVIGTQYGGTGQNFVNISTGSIIYFSSVGVMSTLLPGAPQGLLQTNGYSIPVWTSSPAVSGINLYNVPLTALSGTNLPTSIIVSTNSMPVVNGASVLGNISGAAGSYTGTVLLTQLSSGTLPSTVAASSITVTGVAPGTVGGPGVYSQITVGTDGRITVSTQGAIAITPSQISAGTFPLGVNLPAASVNAGALPGNVVVSSIVASGINPGTYGDGSHTLQVTFGSDGRASAVNTFPIVNGTASTTTFAQLNPAINTVGITATSGTFTASGATQYSIVTSSGINVQSGGINSAGFITSPAIYSANFSGNGQNLTILTPGNLSAGAINYTTTITSAQVNGLQAQINLSTASISITPNITVTSSATIIGPLLITGKNNILISSGITTQPGLSQVIIGTNVLVYQATVTASGFSGPGLGITNLGWNNLIGFPTNCSTGQFVSGVGASLTCGLPAGGGSGGGLSNLTTYYTLVAASSVTATAGHIVDQNSPVFITSATFTNNIGVNGTVSATTFSGSGASLTNLPYGSLTSFPSACGSGNFASGIGSALTCAEPGNTTGNAATATSLAGGSANEIPYQTSAGNTSFSGAGGANSVFFENSGSPSWTNTPTLTGTNFTGVPWSGLSGLPSGCSAGQYVSAIGSSLTCGTPTGTGVTGSGTNHYIAEWSGSTSLGTGLLYDNGSQVGINTTSPSTLLDLSNGGNGNVMNFGVGDGNAGEGSLYASGNAFAMTDPANNNGYFVNTVSSSVFVRAGNTNTLNVTSSNVEVEGNAVIDDTATVTGQLLIGYTIVVNNCGTASSCTATCTNHNVILGGGCQGESTISSSENYPLNDVTWQCNETNGTASTNFTAYAICARLGH